MRNHLPTLLFNPIEAYCNTKKNARCFASVILFLVLQRSTLIQHSGYISMSHSPCRCLRKLLFQSETWSWYYIFFISKYPPLSKVLSRICSKDSTCNYFSVSMSPVRVQNVLLTKKTIPSRDHKHALLFESPNRLVFSDFLVHVDPFMTTHMLAWYL